MTTLTPESFSASEMNSLLFKLGVRDEEAAKDNKLTLEDWKFVRITTHSKTFY
jgi:hypothetical protein